MTVTVLPTTDETVLDASEWNHVKEDQSFSRAQADFDAAVEEFFAPLTEAAEKAHVSVQRPDDPASYVVVSEGTEAVQGRDLPVVMATALFSAVVLIISNLLVDVIYSVLDPRVRLS